MESKQSLKLTSVQSFMTSCRKPHERFVREAGQLETSTSLFLAIQPKISCYRPGTIETDLSVLIQFIPANVTQKGFSQRSN